MEKENLEFYERAYHLREHFRKVRNRLQYCEIIDQLVVIYFHNGNKFPDTLEISGFTYKRISVMQSILTDLGFFNEDRLIFSYNFIKTPMKKFFAGQRYKKYSLTISPK